MNAKSAKEFAQHWVEAWNAHDLDAILSHYTDDFEMSSPIIVSAMNEPSGRLKGKQIIREYWAGALKKYPTLHFEIQQVLTGAGSVTLVYNGVRGISAEVFLFNEVGKVYAAYAHYTL